MTDIPVQAAASNASEREFEAAVLREIKVLRGYYSQQISRHRWSRMIAYVSATLVPVLAAASAVPRWTLGVLGACSVVAGAISELYQFKKSGLVAMQTANVLERQLTRYMASIGPYGRDVPDAFERFATKVEEIREAADKAILGVWEEPTSLDGKASPRQVTR